MARDGTAPVPRSAERSATQQRYARYVEQRDNTNWERYLRELDAVGRLVVVDHVSIDGESLFRRRFTCDPRVCAPGKRPDGTSWRRRGEKSCCAELIVDLATVEVEGLRRHWEPIRAYLGEQDRYFRDRDLDACLELNDDYEVSLRKRGGRCIFALRDGEWGLRCGIHAACLAQGIPVMAAKPVTCDTFPLLVIDLSPGRFYLGAHDDDVDGLASLGQADGVAAFACLANPRRGKRMYEAMEQTIRNYFGDAFYARLREEAARYLAAPRPKRLQPPSERTTA